MKKLKLIIGFFSYLLLSLITSCGNVFKSGKYVFEGDHSYIEFNSNGNYHYVSGNNVHGVLRFSRGRFISTKKYISFYPDSNYYFKVKVNKYYYDPELREKRKIILISPDNNLEQFQFSFWNGLASELIFGNDHSVEYTSAYPSYQGQIAIRATIRNNTILPQLVHDALVSNAIPFSDVGFIDPGSWNVLVLELHISRDMFGFVTLPDYSIHGRKIMDKNIPVYRRK